MKKNKENTNLPSSKEIKDQKSLFKSKTLHELLKQGGGQNLVIDFSMLSKKGNLNGLIERAKKYQNLNNPKIIEESTNENNKKKEYEEKNLKSSKISKNFEILTKFGKKKKDVNNMKNKENDFEEVDEVEEEQNKKKKKL